MCSSDAFKFQCRWLGNCSLHAAAAAPGFDTPLVVYSTRQAPSLLLGEGVVLIGGSSKF